MICVTLISFCCFSIKHALIDSQALRLKKALFLLFSPFNLNFSCLIMSEKKLFLHFSIFFFHLLQKSFSLSLSVFSCICFEILFLVFSFVLHLFPASYLTMEQMFFVKLEIKIYLRKTTNRKIIFEQNFLYTKEHLNILI